MFRLILTVLTLSLFIFSCEKNTDLTPNPAFVAKADDSSSNDPNDDGEGNEDEETKDSTTTQIHFQADINGNLTTLPINDIVNIQMSNSAQTQIIGRKNNGSGFEEVTIHIVNEDIIEGDTLYFDGSGADTRGEYFTDNGTNLYTFFSDNGYVAFNKVTSLQYGATFRFKATNLSSSSDSSVYITNGSFLINRY